jgi:glycine/D-amino acid oxidase-like deaminating enzyme
MPGPAPTPVSGDAALPARADVVVIGGGIAGTSTALELAERGHAVALCEKGVIGGEQSSRNWGWVRISHRDPREIPLMVEALRLWSGMDARIGRATGYRRSGILFAAESAEALARLEAWGEHLSPFRIEARAVRGAGMGALLPGHRLQVAGGFWTPGDGRAEPQLAAPAIAEAAREKGARVLTGCAVRAVERAAGRVAGVVTERGPIACDAVVLAGGAWSRLFAGNAGVELPQLKVLSSVLRTDAVEGGPEAAIWAPDFAIRKRADGGHTIAPPGSGVADIVPDSFRLARAFLPALRAEWRSLSFRVGRAFVDEARRPRRWAADGPSPFESCRVLDPAPRAAALDSAFAAARAAFPALAGARVAQRWSGMIDVTPDAIPVISDVAELPGLYIATGFSGHGFGIGPGAGRLMADLVTGAPPCVDPADFRLSRFFDGSPITVMAGL